MEEYIETLNSLKGVHLLANTGRIYVLSTYTTTDKIVTKGIPFFRSKSCKVSYIDTIVLNMSGKLITMNLDHSELPKLASTITKIQEDRQRYINLLHSLSKMGCIIKKK